MELTNKIDTLTATLQGLKISEKGAREATTAEFVKILEEALNTVEIVAPEPVASQDQHKQTESDTSLSIPSWVDIDYGYDADKPRLPTSREVVEAMTGRTVEELYADKTVDYSKISRSANDLLWGPTLHGEDTRDWVKIFQSDDLIETLRSENHKMLGATVDIVSDYDANGELVAQHAAIFDNKGKVFRVLNEGENFAQEALKNFGVQTEINVQKLKNKIQIPNFNKGILDTLTAYANAIGAQNQLADHELALSIFEETNSA